MIDIKQVHRQAMEARDGALLAKLEGNEHKANQQLKLAFDLEAAAANELLFDIENEPSRSVLFRSAATLAKEYGLFEEAEKLAYKGLAGNPPPQITAELREILEQVTFSRHLEVTGIRLGPDDMQMAMTGAEVGNGIANASAVISRLQTTETMLFRTAERQHGREYRERGRRDNRLSRMYLSVPRAASFALTFRVGDLQDTMPGVSPGEAVVDEFLACLELFTTGSAAELRQRIPDEAYFHNFVGLAKNLQPDGKKVSTVGYTTERHGKPKLVAMRPPRDDGLGLPGIGTTLISARRRNSEPARITGELQAADVTGKRLNEIKIVTEGNVKVTVVVPPGMMDDIVKPLWRTQVEIFGEQRGKKLYLAEIKPVELPE
jgi:hypothetical protein